MRNTDDNKKQAPRTGYYGVPYGSQLGGSSAERSGMARRYPMSSAMSETQGGAAQRRMEGRTAQNSGMAPASSGFNSARTARQLHQRPSERSRNEMATNRQGESSMKTGDEMKKSRGEIYSRP